MDATRIDISADVGESFGNYKLGNDEELLKYITSANVACGFHAGDPGVMRKSVILAKELGVAVGAHPGLPDLLGFGRRRMDISPGELKDYIVYQIGALKGFTDAAKIKMQHVSAHGVLAGMIAGNEGLAKAMVDAIREVHPDLILVARPKQYTYEIAKQSGMRVMRLIAIDLQYRADGTPIIERKKKSADALEVAKKAVRLVKEGKMATVDGGDMEIEIDSLLVHGDGPNVVEIVKAVRDELSKGNIKAQAYGRN
jgi:UPF0271 protein